MLAELEEGVLLLLVVVVAVMAVAAAVAAPVLPWFVSRINDSSFLLGVHSSRILAAGEVVCGRTELEQELVKEGDCKVRTGLMGER